MTLLATACGEPQLAAELNAQLAQERASTQGLPPSTEEVPGQLVPENEGQPMVSAPAGEGTPPPAGGTPAGSEAPPPVAGFAPEDPALPDEGGGSGAPAEGEGGEMGGEGNAPAPGPYSDRTGSFRMLVYSRTTGYRHDSIAQGKTLLREIASERGFEITEAETNELITPEGLAQFEIVFFMNSTGDIFNQAEEAAFQQWMETRNGAMAGVHSATDTEQGWAFYKEVTGQYYDGHTNANTPGAIQFEASALGFPALEGVPNPWQRNEEWYRFNSFQEWTSKPGFQVLGRKQADNQPIMWTREFGNWRSFYSAIGHDAAVFRDPVVKQHLTGGIMWAVRRDHLLP
jgi:type 1 glutamine amidotransferase